MTALSDVDAFTLRDVAAEGDIREQAWYRELVSGDVEGRSVKHLPDGEMKAARSADRYRAALTRIASRVAFHLPGEHDQRNHGDGGGGGDAGGILKGIPVLDQAGYEESYGDVIDEESVDLGLGDGTALTVRYFESSDAHTVLDLPDGKYQVLAETNPDGMRALADDLQRALDVDPDEHTPDSTGLVWDTDSSEHEFYIGVDEAGDIRLHPGGFDSDYMDVSPREVEGFMDALRNMADGYEDQFDAS